VIHFDGWRGLALLPTCRFIDGHWCSMILPSATWRQEEKELRFYHAALYPEYLDIHFRSWGALVWSIAAEHLIFGCFCRDVVQECLSL
ncbi:hypothetical protein GOP47_0009640, partial [Adiantum capillus-veneris]